MKVLQLGKFYYPTHGGMEQVTYEITQGLNARGIRCDVLCANTKAKNEEIDFSNYKVYKTSSYGLIKSTSMSPQLIFKLFKIHKNYDIIHIHHPNPIAFLALYIVRPKSKIVVHWHSDIIRQNKILKYFLPLQNWVLNNSDKIIATSKNYVNYSTHLQKFKDKTISIPIGISEDKYHLKEFDNIEKKYKNKKIILGLGRLVSYKGFIHLVQSAKYLNDDFIILIAGDGGQKSEILEYILQHKLQDKVELLGYITEQEKHSYLKSCFVFCLPSITKAEAFGVVMLETMIFSKPIISSNLQESGMSWVNKDMVSGLHVQPESPKALSEAFIKLAKDETLYKKLSYGSNTRYKELFTSEKMIDSVEELYKSIF